MAMINKVLLATDFSDASQQAQEMAGSLQKKLGCHLEVVHVFFPSAFQMPAPYELMADVGQWLDENFSNWSNKGRKALDELVPKLANCKSHFLHGKPGVEIVKLADKLDCDLIVMGTHNYKGWDRIFLGSVAEYVTQHAPCAVLTTKPKAS